MTAIHDQPDSSLLAEFAAHRSQDAFTELVSRHSNWVYSAAGRMVRDPHLAEDVTQAVFLVMADKAGKLGSIPLHRWLFKVTRYASANAIRARARRDKYERLAAMSSSETQSPQEDKLWTDISPVLDELMSRLRSQDRDAIILRFYQQKSVAEVGTVMGLSEGAAKIRIRRAIEKLRDILRRRGITVPAETLSAAMLLHTTHAAPAHLAAGCATSSASIKATAISKGVIAMTVTTKAKIAAIVIVLAAIPIGAGAIYMASTPNRAMETAPAAVSPATETSAATNLTFGFDPRVEPFITNRTDLVLVIDLTKIDLDALAADMQTEIGKMRLDASSVARVNGMIQMGLGAGKVWINGFKQAGGTNIYMLSRADELKINSSSGSPGMKMTATIVYPTDSPAAAQTLAKYLTSPRSRPPKIVGTSVVDQTSNPYAPPMDVLTDPRPALAEGLLAAADSPVRATVNPLKLKEIMPKLMASGNINMKIAGNEWDGLQSALFELILPPDESPRLSFTSRYPDPASAENAKNKASERIAQTLKPQSGANTPITAAMMNFISTEKFATSGSDVVGTMDLHAYWRLLFSAILSATPATQPQAQKL